MKNVTDSLKPSMSTAVDPARITFDWSNPDFTITIPDVYLCNASYPDVCRYQESLKSLMKEAVQRGYTVREWKSMETMCRYVHFLRTGPAIELVKHNRIEESAPIEAEEVIEVKRIK